MKNADEIMQTKLISCDRVIKAALFQIKDKV